MKIYFRQFWSNFSSMHPLCMSWVLILLAFFQPTYYFSGNHNATHYVRTNIR